MCYKNDDHTFYYVSDHDAVRFMKRKAETKTSAPELDAEVDKEILTIGTSASFNSHTSYESKRASFTVCHVFYILI
jgi:hypothetical protein